MTEQIAEIVKFEWDHKKSNTILTHQDLQRKFYQDFNKTYNPKYEMKIDSFIKVSDCWTKSNDMELMYYPAPKLGEEIHKVDDVRFVGDALNAVKQYRIIGDKLYKFVDDDINYGVGQHIFAVDNKPLFNIDILENSRWAYKPFYISSRKTKNSFQYVPNLDAKPNYIELELITKDPNENIIINMFKDVKLNYIDMGLNILENKILE